MKIADLVESKLLIEDKHRVKFYDQTVFAEVKKGFDQQYQSIELDPKKLKVNLK